MTRSQEQMEDNLAYGEKTKKLQVARRNKNKFEEEKHHQQLAKLQEEHNIAPKEYATYDNLVHMIRMVLFDFLNGTKAIREYAEIRSKDKKWIDEVAKPKAGKEFKRALQLYSNTPLVKAMKKNNIYDEKDILNNTVTGALTKLSKQVKLSKLIDDLRSEVATLKKNLAAKEAGQDWRPEALRLTDEGMSTRKIAEQISVGKTTVANFLKEQKTNSG